MLVTSRRNLQDFSISLNNEKLDQCESYKYLGVYIDKDLSWKPHINYICSKISKACGAISKTRHVVSIQTLKSIYHALINSYLRYGILSWGNASSESMKPLNTLINRAVRIMSFAPFGKLNTKPIFEHLKLLDIDQTFRLETAKFIFKDKNNLLPISTIAHHFDRIPSTNRPVRQTRSSHLIVAPYELLSVHAKKSIQMKTNQFWNDIPPLIKSCPYFSSFKRLFKEFLIHGELLHS